VSSKHVSPKGIKEMETRIEDTRQLIIKTKRHRPTRRGTIFN